MIGIVEQSKTPWKVSLRKRLKDHWELYLFMLPALAAIILFSYVPMYGITMAFKDVPLGKTVADGTWVGLKHFNRLFASRNFTNILRNTILVSLWSSVFTIPFPIILGVLLHNCPVRGLKKTAQTATYLPHLVSSVIVVSILNLFCNGSTGLINILRANMNLPKISFFGQTKWFIPLYVISGVWQGTGYGAVTYLAALSAVDIELIDAAKIDGANKLQRIWNIDIPTIKPTIITLLILNIGHIFGASVDKVLLMQTPLNLEVSEVIGTYVYKCGIENAQYSFSTAVGLFNNLVNFGILLIANFLSKKLTHTYLF